MAGGAQDMGQYRVIGVMSGSSLDGLDIIYVVFNIQADNTWKFRIEHTLCRPYKIYWLDKLKHVATMDALDYQLVHSEYGRSLGDHINNFIREKKLAGKIDLVACQGHTVFHLPSEKTTVQLGDGGSVAAITCLPTVIGFRSIDVALMGQGSHSSIAAERRLFGTEYQFFLNIGGMACLTYVGKGNDDSFAADVCPANQLLNMLAQQESQKYDNEGGMASSGSVNSRLLHDLDDFDHYKAPFPKSLRMDFGPQILYPLILAQDVKTCDALRTFTEHICNQVAIIVQQVKELVGKGGWYKETKMLVTGGGALNTFLVWRLSEVLLAHRIQVVVPSAELVKFKDALMTAALGVFRVREEANFFSKVSGSERDSVGGALWSGKV